MARYNRTFDLTPEDMDLIEDALMSKKREKTSADPANDEARAIHDLLGRLHNQKVFYRPKSTYIGG